MYWNVRDISLNGKKRLGTQRKGRPLFRNRQVPGSSPGLGSIFSHSTHD